MKQISKLEVPYIQEGKKALVGALVEITAPTVEVKSRKRKQQAVVFLIDRSGSMDGRPLEIVRNTINEIIGKLDPSDMVSVISFDTQVENHVPLVQLGQMSLQGIRQSVNEIEARGGTDISLGYQAGLNEAAKSPDEVEARVILLSDGHANRGVIDPNSFAKTAASATEHLIKTSTIGIGESYDEKILDQMAQGGAGNHFAAFAVEEAVTGLNDEIDGLLSRSLSEVQIEVIMPEIKGLEIQPLGYTRKVKKTDRGIVVTYGEMASNETRGFAFVMTVPKLSAKDKPQIELSFKSKAVDVETGEQLRSISRQELEVVETVNYKAPVRDENVAAEVMAFKLADLKKQAAEAAWSGDLEKAREIIRGGQTEVEAIARNLDKLSPRLKAKILEERSELAQFMTYREAELSKRATESSYRSARSKTDPRRS
jgi:Ca-activated chloride channel family protein